MVAAPAVERAGWAVAQADSVVLPVDYWVDWAGKDGQNGCPVGFPEEQAD